MAPNSRSCRRHASLAGIVAGRGGGGRGGGGRRGGRRREGRGREREREEEEKERRGEGGEGRGEGKGGGGEGLSAKGVPRIEVHEEIEQQRQQKSAEAIYSYAPYAWRMSFPSYYTYCTGFVLRVSHRLSGSNPQKPV